MAILSEKMTEKMMTLRLDEPSMAFGFIVLDNMKYSCAPIILHAMWIVESA